MKVQEYSIELNELLPRVRTIPSLPEQKKRLRRNRKTPAIRALVQETHLLPQMLVAPLFVIEGCNQRQPISSLPGIERLSIDLILQEVQELFALGIQAVNLFPVIQQEQKDHLGFEAIREGNLMQRAIEALKAELPQLYVMVDIALDPFTSHGHDGVIDENGHVINDQTLIMLAQMSILAAEAGVDMVAPSDMMDGRIGYIRETLDSAGYTEVGILAYAAKYASALYGPFREALQSGVKIGDKRGYQLNPANRREALEEIILDDLEGADMLLIKPALPYLDIIAKAREITHLPIGAYHVSGEYAMVMAAAQQGWLNADAVFWECLLGIRRAGADFIFTYAAKRIAQFIHNKTIR